MPWWLNYSWLWRSDGESLELLITVEYTIIILNTWRSTLPWMKYKSVALCLFQWEGVYALARFFSVQRYSKAPHYLVKKFLRPVFKVFHSLIQTDVSSFHSCCNLKTPSECSQTRLVTNPGSGFGFPPHLFKLMLFLLQNTILSFSIPIQPNPASH